MAPIFAKCCGFDKPRQHKARGKHTLGFTMLSNSTVSEHVKIRSSRHLSLKTHKRCQRVMEKTLTKNIDKKYKAMNPSLPSCTPTKIPPPIKKVQPISNKKHKENMNVSQLFLESTSPTYHPPNQKEIYIGNPLL